MQTTLLSGLLVSLTLVNSGPAAPTLAPTKKEAVEREKEKLKGEWICHSNPDSVMIITINDSRIIRRLTNNLDGLISTDEIEFAYEIDPTTTPKHFDRIGLNVGDGRARGIYKLDGDTLTIQYGSEDGRERPVRFEKKMRMAPIWVFKRQDK